ncbi:hypothetical protein H5410_032968 [Solanum commersonii]|uniref:Uncharacterized protein n=1 Tax=Solanum commersonii TaxID=4109 RepID=A0A9J5YRQ9_SOLCO|nr:hypothetical protein H5410_032968 [Solanum commersonii]
MRMLRWMCRHSRRDKIINEVIRDRVGVVSVVDKMREARPEMVWALKRRGVDAPIRRCERLDIVGMTKGRGRPK